jgi:GNAT superfamily N-acetyltransferase
MIRPLTATDWPEFWPMLHDMGTDDDEPTARERYLEMLTDPRWGILTADVDQQLIGYVAIQDYGPHLRLGSLHRIARMHDLYVRPEHRRRGIGRELMRGAATWTAGHAAIWNGRPAPPPRRRFTNASVITASHAHSRNIRRSSSTSGSLRRMHNRCTASERGVQWRTPIATKSPAMSSRKH